MPYPDLAKTEPDIFRKIAGLILVGRQTEQLNALKTELSDQRQVHTVTLDVYDRKRVTSQLRNLPNLFQNVTVLINITGLAFWYIARPPDGIE